MKEDIVEGSNDAVINSPNEPHDDLIDQTSKDHVDPDTHNIDEIPESNNNEADTKSMSLRKMILMLKNLVKTLPDQSHEAEPKERQVNESLNEPEDKRPELVSTEDKIPEIVSNEPSEPANNMEDDESETKDKLDSNPKVEPSIDVPVSDPETKNSENRNLKVNLRIWISELKANPKILMRRNMN